jgi:hypothetical protein
MANEFIIKNGYFSQGNSNITGSLAVTGGITGSLQGTASYATTALSASYAPSSGGSTNTGSLLLTASFADPVILFTKGDNTTFNVDLSSISSQNPIGAYATLTSSILSGTTITLPGGLTYVSSSTYEYIEVHVNGLQLRYDIDFIPITNTSLKYLLTIPSGSEIIYKSYKRP